MLEETIKFCQSNAGSSVQDIRFVVYQQDQKLIAAFKQEMDQLAAKCKSTRSTFRPRAAGLVSIEVLQDDLCKEKSDAIVNINSKDMNMDSAGSLSKAVKLASGPQVEAECNQLGQQSGGTAVITSGGNLPARHIIHLIPDSEQKDHLQQCVEKCFRLAEARGLQSISIPAVGTGAYGMSAVESATLIFKALCNFSGSSNTVRKVRIVIFQPEMLHAFQQEHKKHSTHSNQSASSPVDVDEEESEGSSLGEAKARSPRPPQRASHEHSVKISVIGQSKASVEKAVESLKKGFSEACTMEQVEDEVISQLSQKQINSLRRKAEDRDVKLEVEAVANRIEVRGQPTEVSSMVAEIRKEIKERTKRKQEEEQALLLSKDIEWSYEIHGNRMVFGSKANAKIEMAHSRDEPRVQVSLRADQFVIDLKTKTGRGQKKGEKITLNRKVKAAEEG